MKLRLQESFTTDANIIIDNALTEFNIRGFFGTQKLSDSIPMVSNRSMLAPSQDSPRYAFSSQTVS